jgi:mannose-6-phosphate isomerase-like protein (cupin superfamily)
MKYGAWDIGGEVVKAEYMFIRGRGVMELDDERFDVIEGDTVLIQDGVFHRVHAGVNGCYFVCVFDGRRNH